MKQHRKYIWIGAILFLCILLGQAVLQPKTSAESTVWNGTADTSWYDGHEDETVYTITTPEQLAGLAQLVNDETTQFAGKQINLANDLYFNEQVLDADGNLIADTTGLKEWTPIGKFPDDGSGVTCDQNGFQGSFNGNGYVLHGIYVNQANNESTNDSIAVALFRILNSNGLVENVGITDSYFKGYRKVGSLAGYSWGTIRNCYSDARVQNNNYSGGLVGIILDNSTTSNCVYYGTIDMTGSSAGLLFGTVQKLQSGSISDCYGVSEKTSVRCIGYDQNTTSVKAAQELRVSSVTAEDFAAGKTAWLLNVSGADTTQEGYEFSGKWMVQDGKTCLVNQEGQKPTYKISFMLGEEEAYKRYTDASGKIIGDMEVIETFPAGYSGMEGWLYQGEVIEPENTVFENDCDINAKLIPTQITLSKEQETTGAIYVDHNYEASAPIYDLTAIEIANDADNGTVTYQVKEGSSLPDGLELEDGKVIGTVENSGADNTNTIFEITGKNGTKTEFTLTYSVSKVISTINIVQTNSTNEYTYGDKITFTATPSSGDASVALVSNPDGQISFYLGTDVTDESKLLGTSQLQEGKAEFTYDTSEKQIACLEEEQIITAVYDGGFSMQEGSAATPIKLNKKEINVCSVDTTNISSKEYDGTTTIVSETVPEIQFEGVMGEDVPKLTEGYQCAYADANVSEDGKVITVTNLALDASVDVNQYYSLTSTTQNVDSTLKIVPKEIVITPDAGQMKYVGMEDPVFTYTNTSLLGSDKISGELKRVNSQQNTVGEYAYDISDLGTYDSSDASNLFAAANYSLKLADQAEKFQIEEYTAPEASISKEPDGLEDWYKTKVSIVPPENHQISTDGINWETELSSIPDGDYSTEGFTYYLKSTKEESLNAVTQPMKLYFKQLSEEPVIGEVTCSLQPMNQGYIIGDDKLEITIPVTGKYLTSVTATITASSGAKDTKELSIAEGKAVLELEAPCMIKSIDFVAANAAGNQSESQSLGTNIKGIILESYEPMISITFDGTNYSDTLYDSNVKAEVTIEDADENPSCGLKSITYILNGDARQTVVLSEAQSGFVTNHSFTIELSQQGMNQLCVTAADNAGNQKEQDYTIGIYKPVEASLTQSNPSVYDGDKLEAGKDFLLNMSNTLGSVSYEYKLEGQEDEEYTAGLPTEVGTYVIRATIARDDKNFYQPAATEGNVSIIKAEAPELDTVERVYAYTVGKNQAELNVDEIIKSYEPIESIQMNTITETVDGEVFNIVENGSPTGAKTAVLKDIPTFDTGVLQYGVDKGDLGNTAVITFVITTKNYKDISLVVNIRLGKPSVLQPTTSITGSSGDGDKDNDDEINYQVENGNVVLTPSIMTDNDGTQVFDLTNASVVEKVQQTISELVKEKVEDSTIIINIKNQNSASQVKLSSNMLKLMVQEKIKLEVQEKDVIVTWDYVALQTIIEKAGSEVEVIINPVQKENISAEVQEVVGTHPVYDIEVQSNGKKVTQFGEGKITIAINYAKKKSELAEGISGVYIKENEAYEWLGFSNYNEDTEQLKIITNHLSTYGVGYEKLSKRYSDIKTHWAYSDINFAVMRGYIKGKSTTKFAPNAAITKAMVAQALGKLSGIDVTDYTKSSFTDVKSKSTVSPYIEWAVENKIISGSSSSKFRPNKKVTREELAVIIYKYAKAMDITLNKERKKITFADASKITKSARKAVNIVYQEEILDCKSGTKFAPKSSATKGELAAALHNIVKNYLE